MVGPAAEAVHQRCTMHSSECPGEGPAAETHEGAGTFLEGKRAHAGGCWTGARRQERRGVAFLPGCIIAG